MKKIITLAAVFAGLFCFTNAFSQQTDTTFTSNVLSEEEIAEPLPYKVYCEIVSYGKNLFSNKTQVELDFGQYTSWLSLDRTLVDERGNHINFNSMLEAANYMARRGWELEEAFVEITSSKGDSNTPHYHWIMSKLVTSDDQITEGILTAGMLKQR